MVVAILAGIFHLCLFAAVPYGRQDFPFSDDWANSLGAFSFLRGDGPRYCEWSATPQIGQWIWSAPFVAFFGPTHQALRISTEVLHVAFASLLTYVVVRLRVKHASAVAICVAFHPVMCLAAVSFLTDVPTLAFALASLACWSLTNARSGGFWGTVFAIAAVLNRQTAVAVPSAILFESALPIRGIYGRRFFGPVVVLAVGVATAVWFRSQPEVVSHQLRMPTLGGILEVLATAVFFCGLGFAPVVFWTATTKKLRVGVILAIAIWGCWALARRSDDGGWMNAAFPFPPGVGNLLTVQGPFGDAFTIGKREPLFGATARWILTGIAILGAGGLFACVSSTSPRDWASPFVLFGFSHLLLPVVSTTQFDRYYLPILVGAAFLFPRGSTPAKVSRWPIFAAAIWVIASFVLCRDWLAVSAAKWELGRNAVASGIPIEEIEGGLEWDFHHAWKNGRPPNVGALARQGFAVPFSLERLKHLTGRYALSLGTDPRFQEVDRIAYRRWLPWRKEEVVLLKAW